MTHSGTALLDPTQVFAKIGLAAGMRVADFGCGRTGHFVFPASKIIGELGVVYALDIMKDVVASIQSRVGAEGLGNIQAVWTDLESVGAAPIPEKSLDAGFFVNVMFMIKKRPEALREAARLLKDDGYLVVVDWDKKLGPLGPTPEQMVNVDDLVILATKEGLKVAERFPINGYHFCVIFKKNKTL
ncbi:MAG: class I SAM-dependent methyltransferase [Patescibacteria group bacterium]|nr:class I SAM-dependent methyltransferase [Patescibacteria group bacterium]